MKKRLAFLASSLILLVFVVLIVNVEFVNATVNVETVVELSYDDVSSNGFDENGLAVVSKLILNADGSGRLAPGVINKQGDIIVPIGLYDIISDYSEGLASVDKGFIDVKGNLVISFPHSDAGKFANGLCVVSDNNGKWGVLDRTGKVVVPFEYRKIEGDFSTGYCVGLKISTDNTSGAYYILSKQGVTAKLDVGIVKSCTSTGAIAKKGDFLFSGVDAPEPNSSGYVDVSGKLKVPYIYDYLLKSDINIRGDYLIAKKGEYYGVIDLNGNTVLDFKYQDVLSYADGVAYVCLNDKIGCVDTKGKEILPFVYDEFSSSSLDNDYVILGRNSYVEADGGYLGDGYGYADLKGNLIMPTIYWRPDEFTIYPTRTFKHVSEFVLLNQAKKVGCIDTKGKVVIPFTYEEISPFAGGLAAVMKNGKYGYVDKSGKVVIKTMYDNVDTKGCVAGGLNFVEKGTKWGFIDMNNTPVTSFIYELSEDVNNVPTGFKDGVAWVSINYKFGLLKYDGTATPTPVLKFEATIPNVRVGKQQKILLSGTAENDTYLYTSANKKIATVDINGNVFGKKIGSTMITIKSKLTGQVCSVKVKIVK